ncbi:hypothetical protein HOLleu_27079 [Holothuria leucospilota]|uniref:Uncharacterized protein n=1 Tax=Holothuria leucospilota TaxID=206669 RepID=A0A9Q1H2Z0_HOLLE|nr:hypothetical protein HOLleu_27079 [Holothuria leucospilota]
MKVLGPICQQEGGASLCFHLSGFTQVLKHFFLCSTTQAQCYNLGQNSLEHPCTPVPPYNVGGNNVIWRCTALVWTQHCTGGTGVS